MRCQEWAGANLVYVPDEAACFNFFLLLHATYNSVHLVGYDLSDLLPCAVSVQQSLCADDYNELATFARHWADKLSASQLLVLASMDYDVGNHFSFSQAALALLDDYAERSFSALVAENYNENQGRRYYQGFIVQGRE